MVQQQPTVCVTETDFTFLLNRLECLNTGPNFSKKKNSIKKKIEKL